MTISRRSFARSIIAAVAGVTVLRQAVAVPVKEPIAEAFGVPVESVPEGPRTIADREVAVAWKAYHIRARRITVTCRVSRELLEDSPFDIRSLVEARLAAAMAKKIDEEWVKGAEYTVEKSCDYDSAKLDVAFTHTATEDKSHVLRRTEWLRRRALGEWDGTPTLPDGWKCGSYATADEWHSPPRGRFDFMLDTHSPPR